MKTANSSLCAMLAMSLTVGAASAQTLPDLNARLPLEQPPARQLNRLGASYLMGFNMSASFKNLGGYTSTGPASNPQRTPNGDPYNYANGYIYPDATTTSAHPGYTWYYGYAAGTPVNGTDFELYRASSQQKLSSGDQSSSPYSGFEITYNRELGRLGRGGWGLEAAAGYVPVKIEDNSTFRTSATRLTDTYRAGGGAQLSPAPQANPFEGPPPGSPGWPLVGLTPANSALTTVPGATAITGHRELDAQVFSFRLGPYVDVPLNERLTLSLSGGLLLLDVNSDFEFDETVSISPSVTLVGQPSEKRHGSGSASDLLAGGFVSGKISYALSERFVVFGGGQFRSTGDFSQTVAGKTAVLSLGQAVFVTLGVSYSF